jgi:hypothetical protein
MANWIRAQVVIPRDSAVPADYAINVLHFAAPGVDDETDYANIVTRLTTFYQAVDAYLSAATASPATVKLYSLLDPEPRAPVHTDSITLTPGSGTGYPGEVAICCSFQGDLESGQLQARRRGRIYLGPLDADTGTGDGNDERVSSGVRTAICTAMDALATPGVDAVVWSVFSPTSAGSPPWDEGTLSSSFVQVTNGWVDNAFDVQRRRGVAATARTTWTV